jgi:argininosuccinate lyase
MSTVGIFNAMVPELEFDAEQMEAAGPGLPRHGPADYLVRKGVPF